MRQGDPQSPLLFCLVVEVSIRGITMLITKNQINLIKGARNYFILFHTLYEDGIMILSWGDQKSIKAISKLISDYTNCSVPHCNVSKSLIYASGMSHSMDNLLAGLLGFIMAFPPFIYLRAPIFIGRPKAFHFQHITNKTRIKLAAWKISFLFIAWIFQLVRFVVLSMMMHCITIYSWPKESLNLLKLVGGISYGVAMWIRRRL